MLIRKKWTSFKERTCPTLSISINPIAAKIAVGILGTAYNTLVTIFSSHNPSFDQEAGTTVRVVFTFVYLFLSAALVYSIGHSRGRRRVLGVMVVSFVISFISLPFNSW